MRTFFSIPLTAAIIISTTNGCLEPPQEEAIPLESLIGDPTQAPSVTTLPDYATRLPEFTQQIDYLRGFAEGRAIWYWNVDGTNSRLIAPTFDIVGSDDALQFRVIDVIPGDPGYTPWWRIVRYRVTDRWNGEVFTSRAAIDAAAQAGLLEGPEETDEILNAPVSISIVAANDGDQVVNRAKAVWYRGLRTYWVPFSQTIRVPTGVQQMNMLPVYIFRRIQEATPLYEFGSGIDLNGDEVLDDSNNVFAADVDNEDYTPLWFISYVRTVAAYESIDSGPPRRVGLSSEADFYDRSAGQILSPSVLSVENDRLKLINCPIQTTRGTF